MARSTLYSLRSTIGLLLIRPKTDIITTVPVSVTTAREQRLESNISLVGTINANNNDVNVIAETQGVAKAVYVKVGDFVRAGTVLVQVDDEIPRSNLATAEINFEKSKKDFERAELREIVIGKQSNEFLEVLNGLSLGDTVVTSGQNNLVDSTRVSIVGAR